MIEQSKDTTDGGFSPDWLKLREPADHAARNHSLASKLKMWAHQKQSVHVLDLGAGTGSNLRYLAPLLGHNQYWTLVDNDERLLGELSQAMHLWANSVSACVSTERNQLTLSADDFSASLICTRADLVSALPNLPFQTTDIVTASALLDLTSSSWLDLLADQCVQNQCSALFALNYDGHVQWIPPFEEDKLITQYLNDHQTTDKGFGHALGPAAAQHLENRLCAAGRTVLSEQSNWELSSDQYELQAALLEGWLEAVSEMDLNTRSHAQKWCSKRIDEAVEPGASLCIGHRDLLSLYTD